MTDKIENVVKLSPAMMKALADTVPGRTVINVAQDTSPLQAGYMLGVQAVFNALREGFTYDVP